MKLDHIYEPGIPGVGLFCRVLKTKWFWSWIEYRDFDRKMHKTLVWNSDVFKYDQ